MRRNLLTLLFTLLIAGSLYAASLSIGVKGASNKWNGSVTMSPGAYSIISTDYPKLTLTLKKPTGSSYSLVYVVLEYINDASNQASCKALMREDQGVFFGINATDLASCQGQSLSGYEFANLTSGGTYTYTLELDSSESYNAPINIYAIMLDNNSNVVKADFKTILLNPDSGKMFGVNNSTYRFDLQ